MVNYEILVSQCPALPYLRVSENVLKINLLVANK